MEVMKDTIKWPNRDTYIGPHTILPKEVLQTGLSNTVGRDIDYLGVPRRVRAVRVTDDFIYLDLYPVEGPTNEEGLQPCGEVKSMSFSLERGENN